MDALGDSYIDRQIRRTNRNLLLVNGTLLAIMIAVVALNYRYAMNFVRGPRSISAEELLAIQNPEERPQFFVRVTGDQLRPTGYEHVEQQVDKYSNKVESETVKYDYKALRVGPRWLLVKAPGASTAAEFSGALLEDSESASVIAQLDQAEPGAKSVFLPFVLDTVDYRDDGYWALGIGIPVLLLVAWNLKKWMMRNADRSNHPIYKKLRSYGEPEQLRVEIENEMAQQPLSISPALITRAWVFVPFFFGLKMSRLADIVWLYKKVTKHSYNFIPTGKTYAALLWSRSGESIEVSLKEKKTDELLQTITARVPWALLGFSNEIQGLWNSNRAALLQAVEERRAKFLSAQSSSSAHA
jgi:hypothetical protein